MTDQPTSTADVSCRICGSGFWVTNPEKFAWSGCPDCRRNDEALAACRRLLDQRNCEEVEE